VSQPLVFAVNSQMFGLLGQSIESHR
jgi:hypothetical protein